MTWPPRQPGREEIAKQFQEGYDLLLQRARRLGKTQPEKDAGYYGRLLLSPEMATRLTDMGRTVRALGDREDSYSHKDREFVDQVLSVDLKTNVIQRIHINDAISTGVRVEAIEALRSGQEEKLNPEETELTAFIRRVLNGQMDRGTWDGMEKRMGERGVLDYAIFVLFLQLTMRLQQAVGMPEPSDAEIDSMIEEYKSGVRTPNNFRERIG